MSNIIPKLSEDQISEIPSKAEQVVYRALKEQLPEHWLVIHSLEYVIVNPRYESHADREADFVIFAPEYGVLVVEVKGGGIGYNKVLNEWYSIDRYGNENLIKNPLKQSKDAKYEIRRHLSSRLGRKDLLLAHAALFPDIIDSGALQSHDSPVDILGTSTALDNLHEWCEYLFKYWAGEEPKYEKLGIIGINVATNLYGKKASIKPSLAVIIEREAQIQLNLTNQQKSILRQLKKRSKAIIEGGAGTGKTVLALDHAHNLAEQGLKVLLLCYNKQLGNVLKKRCEGIEDLHAMNFHELCHWRIEQVKKTYHRDLLIEAQENYPNANKFEVLYPDALINSFDIVPLHYDAIIVDEGQDFTDEYWLAVEMLFESQEKDTRLYIFQDGNQAIYTSSEQLPIDEFPLYLTENCRNTKPIHNAAYQYYQGEDINPPELAGESIVLFEEVSFEKQASVIDKEVYKLIHEDKVSPEDITVLVTSDYDNAATLLKSSKHNQIWAFKDYAPKQKILVETAKRFKGLESKIIFLWIPSSYQVDDKLLYVSISRARLRLWIIGDEIAINRILE